MINNFERFPFDRSDSECFYFFQIINRDKQSGNNKIRCIKSYFVDTYEYLQKVMPSMIQIADITGCRIYVHPARRSKKEMALQLISHVADCIATNTVDGLRRGYETVCGRNKGVEKRRIVDIDSTDVAEVFHAAEHIRTLRPNTDDFFINQTPNGFHLIYRSGFDLSGYALKRDIHKNNPTVIYAK